jgi:hypothetical protein
LDNIAKSQIQLTAYGYNTQSYSLCGNKLEMNRMDYIRSILTVGFQDYAEFDKMHISLYAVRVGAMISTIPFLTFNNDLELSQAFSQLDRSEKTILNYWYGMTFTKIVAEQLFDVPWLANVDRMINSGIVNRQNNNRRITPDLAGFSKNDTTEWHVFEAKGRYSRTLNKDELKHAKDQAKSLASINSNVPKTTNVCIFVGIGKPKIFLHDPSPQEDGIILSYSEGGGLSFFDFYYNPFRYIFSKYVKFKTITCVILNNELLLSIPEAILENPNNAIEVCNKLPTLDSENAKISLGKDGVLLRTKEDFKLQDVEKYIANVYSVWKYDELEKLRHNSWIYKSGINYNRCQVEEKIMPIQIMTRKTN